MRVTSFIALGFVVILQYQNCAKAGGTSSADLSSPVSIIDKNNQGYDVSFQQTAVTIQSSVKTVDLNGACSTEQEGTIFQWQLKGADQSVLDTGSASCQSGAFVVAIAPTQSLDCDQPYQVTAQMGTGQSGEVLLTRSCAAQTSAAVNLNQKSLVSDSLLAQIDQSSTGAARCFTEKREGSGSGCSVVCYSSVGVELQRESIPTSSCDGF